MAENVTNTEEEHPNISAIRQLLGPLADGLRYATAQNGNVNMQPATLKGDKMKDVLGPFMAAAEHLVNEGLIQTTDVRVSAARVITQEDVGETVFESKLSIWWNKEEYRQNFNNVSELEDKMDAFQQNIDRLEGLLRKHGVAQSDLDALSKDKTEDEMPQTTPQEVEVPC